MSDIVSYDVMKDSLPKQQRKLFTEEIYNKLVELQKDPLLIGTGMENFITYSNVMKTGKYKMEDYLNAIKYVSYKLLGDKDIEAYIKTFPHRYEKLKAEGLDKSAMGAYVNAYKKNQLVVKIMEQTLVPTHILNAPLYQEALNVNVNLMYTARSEMVKQKAAEAVMAATKQPETAKLELDVNIHNNALDELTEQLNELATDQLSLLTSGKTNLNTLGGLKPKDDILDAEVE